MSHDAQEGQYFNIIVINLDRDTERFNSVSKQISDFGLQFHRLSAINGASLPRGLLKRVKIGGRAANNFPGTFGCLTSHIKAWETSLTLEKDFTLILEDDIVINSSISSIDSNFFSQNFDLYFANNRISSHFNQKSSPVTTYPFAEVAATRPSGISTPGGDGYFVSKSGARKLLERINWARLPRHVDQFLVSASLVPQHLDVIEKNPALAEGIKSMGSTMGEKPEISSVCIIPAIVQHIVNSKSSRISSDQT
ncbi:hypothetical protein GCM10008171_23800 [Methylopila jiangsuensis]|uniref:Glycosyl transferase family 25 domain-containing protein n=1 Tax=Methylopila jiangsuensis TaxID=586230 RepID=A0A9W6N4D3_9HYPH|nr:glycosyltransferase family 25 protein [Methylopila jiangsuensis]MDR6286534.1 glycosyl transferase family 25 [Methylopila jiangsuensis]GLK77126.1 hypothetical protein GCM10008171_23800 [Methylopila jiangsuensis]